MNQIELHKKIDELVLKNPDAIKKEEILELISVNNDARQYFFVKVDERWLNWLWNNGFLDVIKEKSEDSTRYGGRKFPELDYLVKVSEKNSSKVADIILEVPTSADHFNPEVLGRFLWICGILPAEELKRIVPRIEGKKWIPLMGAFNQWGFEYEKMFQTLEAAKDYDNIITLAKAVLSVRPKEVVKKEGFAGISTENFFYFNDLSYTKVFQYLAGVDSEHAEQALAIAIKTMEEIVNLSEKTGPGGVFAIQENFHLFDVDFFTLELGQKERLSHRDDIRELAAVIKELAEKTIGSHDTDPSRARELYKKYFESLPDSRSMWRLKLFAMTLYPEYFKDELKNAFFKLFTVEQYHEIISGAEYERALQKGFPFLTEEDKLEYVKKVIEYFKKKDAEKENEKENWHLQYGADLLSIVADQLNENEKLKKLLAGAEKAGFKINPSHEPEPSIVMGDGFAQIIPQAPFTYKEFQDMTISDISKNLRSELSPEALFNKYRKNDFHRPVNAEGVGDFLKKNIAGRLQDYVNNAGQFFERDVLDAHYTYSFFRGVQEAVKNNKEQAGKINWEKLIDLCVAIEKSGKEKQFEKEKKERDVFDAWLAGWNDVHSAMADVIQELLNGEEGIIDFSKYRNELLDIISYLLTYPDPTPKDEDIETAGMKTHSPDSKEYLVSDPFTMAINRVRGRAFQAFVLFLYQDGKKFKKEEIIKISPDVKKLYESVLNKEDTRAIMFMFGHYIPSFYFRDTEWLQRVLPQIFPTEPEKKYLYLAAWEGYLANNLYKEIFADSYFQDLYKRGIALTETEYPKQKHFREPDQGVAIHLALAFMYYEDFGFDHQLFKAFWEKNDPEQHADFISFLGRMFVSGSNRNADELLKTEPKSKQRLKDFWDWLLKNYEDPRPFIEMGFWMSLGKNIFDVQWLAEHIKKTLEKTKGVLNWDYELMKSIVQLAKEAPEDTLEIARLYLLEGGVRGPNKRIPFHIENEWLEVFKMLYNNQTTKSGAYALINDLIREGGSTFWGLKDILDAK